MGIRKNKKEDTDDKVKMRTRNKDIIEAIIAVGVPVVIALYLLLFHTNLIIISNPDSNIYIEHLNWTDVTRINETAYRVTLSGDITYRYKASSLYYSGKDEPLPDDLPVRIQVFAGPGGGGVPYITGLSKRLVQCRNTQMDE